MPDKIGRFATEERPRCRDRAPLAQPRRPRGGGQPHPVLRARPPVLAAGDVRREPAVPAGSRRTPPRATAGATSTWATACASARGSRTAVTFDDDDLDYRGFPNMTIEYELTDAENAEIAAATERLRRAGDGARQVRRRAAAAAERLEPALHGHDAHRRDGRRHLGRRPVVAGLGRRRARRRRQRHDPDREHDEPDADERRDRGARRPQGGGGAGAGAGQRDERGRGRFGAARAQPRGREAFFTSNLDKPEERIACGTRTA